MGERGSAFKGEIEEAQLKRYLLLGFPQEWLMAVWLLPYQTAQSIAGQRKPGKRLSA